MSMEIEAEMRMLHFEDRSYRTNPYVYQGWRRGMSLGKPAYNLSYQEDGSQIWGPLGHERDLYELSTTVQQIIPELRSLKQQTLIFSLFLWARHPSTAWLTLPLGVSHKEGLKRPRCWRSQSSAVAGASSEGTLMSFLAERGSVVVGRRPSSVPRSLSVT